MPSPFYNEEDSRRSPLAGHPVKEIPVRMSASQRPEVEPTDSRRETEASASGNPAIFEWTVHLLKREPHKMWGIMLTALVAGLAGLLLFRSAIMGLGGVLLIVHSSTEFLFPIRYRFTSDKIYCAFGLTRYEMRWRDVRRQIPSPGGVKLSPLSVPSRLDAFRGILLRFAEDAAPGNRTQVLSLVEERMPVSDVETKASAKQVSAGV